MRQSLYVVITVCNTMSCTKGYVQEFLGVRRVLSFTCLLILLQVIIDIAQSIILDCLFMEC